jgi:hypothetical protein
MTTTAKEKVSEEKKVEQKLPPVDKVTMPPSNSPFGRVQKEKEYQIKKIDNDFFE